MKRVDFRKLLLVWYCRTQFKNIRFTNWFEVNLEMLFTLLCWQGCKGGSDDWACCSQKNKCGVGEGDCDLDRECQAGLMCGRDNCQDFHTLADSAADCCFEKSKSRVNLHLKYTIVKNDIKEFNNYWKVNNFHQDDFLWPLSNKHELPL